MVAEAGNGRQLTETPGPLSGNLELMGPEGFGEEASAVVQMTSPQKRQHQPV